MPGRSRRLRARVVANRAPAIPDIKPRTAVKPQIGALAYRPDGKLLALGNI